MKAVVFTVFLLTGSLYAQSFSHFPIPSRGLAGNVCTSPDGVFVYFTVSTTVGRSDTGGNIEEFPVPATGTNAMDLVGCSFSPAGILYFLDQANFTVYAFDPSAQVFSHFKVPAPNTGLAGVVFHTDGLLYIMVSGSNAIQRMQPDGTFLPVVHLSNGRYPHGPSSCAGNVWFAENTANRVAFIDVNGSVSEFLLPFSNSKPFSTVCAPDGGVYFTMMSIAARIGRIDTGTFAISTWSVPTKNSMPKGISLASQGVCFAESNVNKIGCMPLGGGTFSEYLIPVPGASPDKLVLGPDGGVWFSELKLSYLAEMQ